MKVLIIVSILLLDMHFVRTECGINYTKSAQNYIIGGREALSGEYPWMASIQVFDPYEWSYRHHCGGAVIDKHWILTAAHCVTGYFADELKVVVGTNHITENNDSGMEEEGYHFNVEHIKPHNRFSEISGLNDIALIKIEGEFNFKASKGMVNKICLPDHYSSLRGIVTASGWGTTEHIDLSTVLLSVDLKVWAQSSCRIRYKGINDFVFCAGGEFAKDTCAGDSGGPVIQMVNNRAVVVGIVSQGHEFCGRSGYPGLYTDVTKYVDWIYEKIGGKDKI